MNPEKPSTENTPDRERPSTFLIDIYNEKNVANLQKILNQSTSDLNQLKIGNGEQKIQENLDWLSNNNNRINLYQITAVINGENYDTADEEMDETKARQFLAYRKIQAILVSAGEIEQTDSVALLINFIDQNLQNTYLCGTAIDSLAKNSLPEAKNKLNDLVKDEKYGFEIRTRALLAGLRADIKFADEEIFSLLSEYTENLDNQLCQSNGTYNIIEIAGLMSNHNLASTILDELHTRMQKFPPEKNQWFERDIISTRLTVKTDDKKEYLDKQLSSRQYVATNGIVFGSLNQNFNFVDFLSKHQDKFDKIAEVLEQLNKAFQTEPILYVDISSGDANEAGWAQNSIYFSSDYIDHSNVVADLLQSTGHEACERWQSKGFMDVRLSKYYLQLMGEKYQDSELDKFRLKHRLQEETNAGHPWDGEREFIAELGSTLLVDPSVIRKLFNQDTDKTALEALKYLESRLNLEK